MARSAVPPSVFVAALTDFSPRRHEIFGNSDASFYEVHELGPNWADVTEGSRVAGGVWQRLRYDWSAEGIVRLDVLDGNQFGKGGWWKYQVTPVDGGSSIDLTIRRVPVTTKARILDIVLVVYGRFFHGRDLKRTLRKLEEAHGVGSSPTE
jgi:hypothetical protein